MTSFLRTRILFSLALGLFVLTASAMADVTYNSDAGTFTGYGTYSGAVNVSNNLTATPTTDQTITFTNNIVSTGDFTQTGAYVVFDTGTTVNSFNALYINNNGSLNNAKMTLSGSTMTLTELHVANSRTTHLDITDGASLSVSGVAYINEANGAQGIVTQTGGTVSFTTSGATDVRIGHWPNTGYPTRYDISGGSLSIPNTTTYVGWDGYAEMNISGGTVSLKGLSLSNNANGKGTLRLTGGTLNIGDGGIVHNKRNVSGAIAAVINLGNGTINATASHEWGSDMTVTLNSGTTTTFNADEGKTITMNSILAGDGALTKTGAGTLTLSGANAYTGGTAINAGTLKLTNSATMGTGTATVASGATVEMGTDSNTAWTWGGGTINGAGTLKVTGGGTFSITPTAMQIANNGSLVADGANIILNNSADATAYYSGAEIYINNGGSVTFSRSGSNNQFWISNQTTITFDQSGGGTFNTGNSSENSLNLVNNTANKFITSGGATNYITGTNGFNLNGGSITFDVAKGTSANGVDLMVSAKLWNPDKTGAVIKDGAGTMVISGDSNNYKGATTVNAGTLKLSGSGKFGNGNGVVTIASGATLTFASDLTQTTIANPISGAGKIVKEGTNTVNLNGRLNGNTNPSYNAFTGDMEIQGGKVSVLMNANSNYFRVNKLSGSGDLEIRLASGTGDSFLPYITKDGFTGKIFLEQDGGSNGNKIHLNSQPCNGFTFVVNSGTTLYYEGSELQANVRLSGNGNSENYGALRLNHNMAGKITVMTDALMGINGSRTVSGEITSGAANGTVNLNIQANGSGTSNTFSRDISDGETSTLGLSIIRRNGTSNTSTFTFTGDLSYSGATSIAVGQTMVLSGANANLNDSSAVTVNGTLNFAGYTGASANTGLDVMQRNIMQLNNLSGTDGVIIGTGKDLILNNSDMSKFIGSITAKTITKTGDETLKIYAAASAGGIQADSLIVSSGALDLKGYMTGSITVDANTIFSPGNSVGEATFGGEYILNDGATLLIEQDATGMDKLTASSFEIHPNSILDLTLGSVQSGEYVILEQKNGDTPVDFGIVTIGGQTYDYSDVSFWNSLLSEDDAYYWNLSVNGNKVMASIDANAVPEPSTWALLILGVAGLLYWRKKK